MNSTLRGLAYIKIRDKILKLDYLPGQKISEQAIMTEIELGRTPTREAVIQLESDGFLNVIPQSGTYISKINLNSVRNACFARENIEKEVIKEVALSHSLADIDKLSKIIELQKFYAGIKDIEKFFQVDEDFHKHLYYISNKEELWDWLDPLNSQLTRFRWLRLKVTEQKWQNTINQHLAIINAITNFNPNGAEIIMQKHLHAILDEQPKIVSKFPNYFTNI